MRTNGKIIEVMELQHFGGKFKKSVKQDIIIEKLDRNKLKVECWNETAIFSPKDIGEIVDMTTDVSSTKASNGSWYTNCKCSSINSITGNDLELDNKKEDISSSEPDFTDIKF